MPITRIEVRRRRSPEEIERFIEALYQAQQEALGVPKWDRQVLYIEHAPQRFAIPPGWSENYTLVDITLLPGRTLEAKRSLYRSIARRFGELGIAAEDIVIVLREPPLEDWGLHGRPASELPRGYDLNANRGGER
jgi:phenylpyruvate tautomerase PptA (4-oxalocrotonate tautomerase family)